MTDKSIANEERLNTIIGHGTVVKGECSVSGTVRVDGTVDGSLSATGVAILGKTGCVKGDLSVHNAIIGGKVEGSVTAKGRLEMQSGASVEGDVAAGKLIMEEGVFFNGECNMGNGEDVKKFKQSTSVPAINHVGVNLKDSSKSDDLEEDFRLPEDI